MQSHVWWADNTSDMTCVQITGNDPLRAASWLAATDNRQVSLLVNWLHANSHQSATELLSTFQPIDRKQLSLESSSPATTKKPTAHVPQLRPTSTGVDRSLDKIFRPPPPQKRRNGTNFCFQLAHRVSFYPPGPHRVPERSRKNRCRGPAPATGKSFIWTNDEMGGAWEPCLVVVVVVVVGPISLNDVEQSSRHLSITWFKYLRFELSG